MILIKRNLHVEMKDLISKRNSGRKRLLLHACCAPCSSAVIEKLEKDFDITLFFYNPNITDEHEYTKRYMELKRLIGEMPLKYPIALLDGGFEKHSFFQISKGFEKEKEGGARCFLCYEQRLQKTAEIAQENAFDYFCTTLSISPYKNAQKLCEIGERVGALHHVPYLPSDFKKENGYKRSIELSNIYKLYRQDYCGCDFSKKQREEQKKNMCIDI